MIDLNKLVKTGNNTIDEEHTHFLTYINNLYSLIEQKADKDTISAKLSEMILCAREHFRHEEDIIQAIDYPDTLKHKREHERILKTMQLAIIQCREDNSTYLLENALQDSIEAWVLTHINEMDIPLLKHYYQQKGKEE